MAYALKQTINLKIVQYCGKNTHIQVEDSPKIELDDEGKKIVDQLEGYLTKRAKELV